MIQMKKMAVLTAMLLLICLRSSGQVRLQNEPARPSAEAWQMTRYGDVAPSLYTGTVALSVPVYTYNDPDFEIPVSLDYSSNGCVPNVRAGVLGPDWTLNAGGVITREVRGFPDEQFFRYIGDLGMGAYSNPIAYDITIHGYWQCHVNNYPASPNNGLAYMSPDNRFPVAGGGSIPADYSGVTEYTSSSGIGIEFYQATHYDKEPDIFHFSVLGHSGSFCLQPDNTVRVFGTDVDPGNYTVDVSLGNGLSFVITIITTSGYRYRFTEGDIVKLRDNGTTGGTPAGAASTWVLDRVTAPNGREVEYNYSTQRNVWNVRPNSFFYDGNVAGVGQSWSSYRSDAGTTVTFIDQCRLDSIVVDNGFSISLSYDSHDENTVQEGPYTNCQRLTSIVMEYEDAVIKTCALEYGCDPQSPSGVKYLSKVSLSGTGDYLFEYFNTRYPCYGTRAVDHWGYYNGRTYGSFLDVSTLDSSQDEQLTANSSRTPDANYSRYGILTKVTYPTGGYTGFEYEANDYSRAVVRTSAASFEPRLSSLGDVATCGGLRIKAVSSYDVNDSLLTRSTYSYRLHDDVTRSSGILLNMPRYKVCYETQIANSASLDNPLTEQVAIHSNNLTRYGQRDIEYTEVTETYLDGCSTRYVFTNSGGAGFIDRLYFGATYPDLLSSPSQSVDTANSISVPPMSLQYLRGRLIETTRYGSDGEVLYRSVTTYSFPPPDSTSSIVVSPTGLFHQIRERADYAGRCNPVSTEEVSVYRHGDVSSSKTFTYNDHGQIATESFTNPDGHSETTRYMYVTDITTPTAVQNMMKGSHAYGRPVSIECQVDGVTVSRTDITYVRPCDGQAYLFREASVIETDLVNGVVTTTSYQYDRLGRVIEKVEDGTHYTAYVWGYGGLYPVAVVDGCPLSTVRYLSGLNGINVRPLDGRVTTPDAAILRSFGECTFYDYEPFVGVTRITEPDGSETVFNYNASGKLSSVNDAAGRKLAGYLYSTDNRVTE